MAINATRHEEQVYSPYPNLKAAATSSRRFETAVERIALFDSLNVYLTFTLQ